MFELNLREIPTEPGVYMFIDANERIIYVGKAKSLRQRLASYFNAGVKTVKTTRMLKNAVRVRTIITSSEVEAFLLESNLIKTELPKYNVLLKDSKGYPYVKLTDEDYPRLIFTRNTADKDADYFGPFVNAGEIKGIIEFIKDVFPLRTCTNSQLKLGKICLKYQIHKCSGPCEGIISKEDYAALVNRVQLFFKGEVSGIKADLKKQMAKYSEDLRYEDAARIRDKLNAIEKHFARQNTIDIQEKRNLDVFYRHEIKNTVGVTQLFLRAGQLLGAKTYFFSSEEDDLLERFIMQFYSNVRQFPDMIAAEGGEVTDVLAEALSVMAGRKVVLRKRGYSSLFEMAEKNAIQATEDYLLKVTQDGDMAARLNKLAGREISRIECIDISHLGGDSTVGVSVVADSGHFINKDYRKYKIRNVGNNDVHAIKELMQRKMANVEDGTEIEADLYLIDGGISQLNAAHAVLEEADSLSACLSISKSRSLRPQKHDSNISIEEIHSHGRKNPHKFHRNDAVLLYLQRLRDEAHRFAISYSRSLALKKRHVSPLLSIPGMGIKRAKALLTAMPDLYSREDLTTEMIINEAHLPAELARKVVDFVKE